jgi:multidrug efflux pump subunit AcrB
MTKITNKQYDEFWEDKNILLNDNNSKKEDIEIKKEIKKEVKKEVKKLEEQVKTILETVNQETIEEKPKPKNKRIIKKEKINEIDNSQENINNIIEEAIENKNITNINVENILEISIEKNLYKKYELDNEPYKIFFRGTLIYNSLNNIQKPEFFDDYFILFGKKYIYRGIRFEKY